jgi:hypothetical protein
MKTSDFEDAIVDRGLYIVMPGLVPASTSFLLRLKTWMAGTSPAMTKSDCKVTSRKEAGGLFVGHDQPQLMSGIAG